VCMVTPGRVYDGGVTDGILCLPSAVLAFPFSSLSHLSFLVLQRCPSSVANISLLGAGRPPLNYLFNSNSLFRYVFRLSHPPDFDFSSTTRGTLLRTLLAYRLPRLR